MKEFHIWGDPTSAAIVGPYQNGSGGKIESGGEGESVCIKSINQLSSGYKDLV